MIKILQSEWIKQKASADKKQLVFVPFLAIFVAFLLVGPTLIESFSIYWWEAIFLVTLIGLLFLHDYKVEEKAGHFQNISLGKDTIKVYIAKMLLKIKDMVIASLCFLGIFYLEIHLFEGMIDVNLFNDLVCLLLMLLASIWVLPFLYVLSTWLNPYLLLVVNSLVCLLVAPFIAQTNVWYLFPYTYHYKVAQGLLHLKPSGDLESVIRGVDMATPILAVVLSVIVFIVFLALLKWRLSHEQVFKK
ncbi:lantibiotic ABC transporter permease [Streptococcus sp. S784/96/1]|uniref:lantibiotic ABC transporter permease n=1 Tax=Streptococcus sp. S784/96/1 TaxID=2653499 RepID=UPI0013866607|nr:lantibiotic ABC transporter permease [Streptococcus sp. S784/96/1]